MPAGTKLTKVPGQATSGTGWSWSAGALTVTGCGAHLESLDIAGDVVVNTNNGTTSASTPCVTLNNSFIRGFVQVGGPDGEAGGPLVMHNDTVDTPSGDDDRSPVLSTNYYAWGLNVEGGRLGFSCQGTCGIHDSWAHAGFLEQAFHYNAIGSNGDGPGPMDFEHNTLSCDFSDASNPPPGTTGGCSDDIGLFGDFEPISNVTISKNLFVSPASNEVPYCFDGNNPNPGKPHPQATNEVVTNNVFQRGSSGKCGEFGPVYSWANGHGNVWSGNVWDDGTALNER